MLDTYVRCAEGKGAEDGSGIGSGRGNLSLVPLCRQKIKRFIVWNGDVICSSYIKALQKNPMPTRYESAPVPLVAKSYKMAASLSICHSSSLFLIAYPPEKR